MLCGEVPPSPTSPLEEAVASTRGAPGAWLNAQDAAQRLLKIPALYARVGSFTNLVLEQDPRPIKSESLGVGLGASTLKNNNNNNKKNPTLFR